MLLLRAGLISFGQALITALAPTRRALGRFMGISDVLAQMLAGALVAGFAAFILGFLLAKYRGIFGLLSLALSMILYGLLVKNEALGSTDGFNILPSTLFGVRPGPQWVRYAVLASAAITRFFLPWQCIVISPRRLAASRPRSRTTKSASSTWAPPRRAVHVKYVIAAVLAGVGGALAATTVGHIDPEMAFWTTSGSSSSSRSSPVPEAWLRPSPAH